MSQDTIIRDALREINQQTATKESAIYQEMASVLPSLHTEIIADFPWVFTRNTIRPVRKMETVTNPDGTTAQRPVASIYGRNYRVYEKPNDYLGYPELRIRDLGIGTDDQETFIMRDDLHIRIVYSDDLFVFEYNGHRGFNELPSYYSRYLSVALAERVAADRNPGQRDELIALLERRRKKAEGSDRSQRDINHLTIGGPSEIIRGQSGIRDPRGEFGIWPAGVFEN